MKKKKLKNLKLNKRVISNIEASNIVGGTIITLTCTFGEICQATREIGEAIADVVLGDGD